MMKERNVKTMGKNTIMAPINNISRTAQPTTSPSLDPFLFFIVLGPLVRSQSEEDLLPSHNQRRRVCDMDLSMTPC